MERAREYLRARFVSGVRASGAVGRISPVSGSIVEWRTVCPYVPRGSAMRGLRGPAGAMVEFHQTVFQVKVEGTPEAPDSLPTAGASPFLPHPERCISCPEKSVRWPAGLHASRGEREKRCRDHTRGTQATGEALGHVQALDRRRPAAPAPGTGTGISRAPDQAAGTGTGKAHATPGTRTQPIPVPLVPRGTGSAGCLRVQAPRGPCPVSGVLQSITWACRACPVSSVQEQAQ